MARERAPRNRTLTLTGAQADAYFGRCARFGEGEEITLSAVTGKTIAGDAFRLMPRMPRAFANLAVVDPPYNLSKQYAGTMFRKMSAEEYRAYTERWLLMLLPLLTPDASVYVCCDWRSSMVVGGVLAEHLILQNRITWQREKGRGAKSNWKNAMEDIWFATRSSRYTFHVDAVKMRRRVLAPYRVEGRPKDWDETAQGNFRNTHPSNFWDDLSVPYWSMPENTDHPAQKPEKLLARLILASSNENDIVFDPFLGSGTTSVVAKKLGRRYCGIETEKAYCALAERRLELAEENRSIQGYRGGVFWERNTWGKQRKIVRGKPRSVPAEENGTLPEQTLLPVE